MMTLLSIFEMETTIVDSQHEPSLNELSRTLLNRFSGLPHRDHTMMCLGLEPFDSKSSLACISHSRHFILLLRLFALHHTFCVNHVIFSCFFIDVSCFAPSSLFCHVWQNYLANFLCIFAMKLTRKTHTSSQGEKGDRGDKVSIRVIRVSSLTVSLQAASFDDTASFA